MSLARAGPRRLLCAACNFYLCCSRTCVDSVDGTSVALNNLRAYLLRAQVDGRSLSFFCTTDCTPKYFSELPIFQQLVLFQGFRFLVSGRARKHAPRGVWGGRVLCVVFVLEVLVYLCCACCTSTKRLIRLVAWFAKGLSLVYLSHRTFWSCSGRPVCV